MTEYLEPANINLSFSDVMSNKKRKLAEDALGPALYLLKETGVPRHLISEVLFKFLKSFIIPAADDPDRANTIWYAQLQRFRDDLQRQIDTIESELDKGNH